MSNKQTNKLIAKAKEQIESYGWAVTETPGHENKVHLELTKDGRRKGWGMFDRLYCWTEAYEAITGKKWMLLLAK